MADGSTASVVRETGEDRERSYVLLRRALDGKELGRMMTIDVPPSELVMISDADSYMTAMMSSAALPNVAFIKPPRPEPSRCAIISVAFPMKPARGMMPRHATRMSMSACAWRP